MPLPSYAIPGMIGSSVASFAASWKSETETRCVAWLRRRLLGCRRRLRPFRVYSHLQRCGSSRSALERTHPRSLRQRSRRSQAARARLRSCLTTLVGAYKLAYMAKRIVGLQDVGFEMLMKAETKQAHPPLLMRSGQSHGPIRMWVCNEPFCESYEYTYGSHATPTCFGGLAWSFQTHECGA